MGYKWSDQEKSTRIFAAEAFARRETQDQAVDQDLSCATPDMCPACTLSKLGTHIRREVVLHVHLELEFCLCDLAFSGHSQALYSRGQSHTGHATKSCYTGRAIVAAIVAVIIL